ncbi:MAG TPA: hypothetical protein DDY98_06370 [Ruminococcaceae bacterium]|nr:hypothetical protein [Oscillospiraceae bacterium]
MKAFVKKKASEKARMRGRFFKENVVSCSQHKNEVIRQCIPLICFSKKHWLFFSRSYISFFRFLPKNTIRRPVKLCPTVDASYQVTVQDQVGAPLSSYSCRMSDGKINIAVPEGGVTITVTEIPSTTP